MVDKSKLALAGGAVAIVAIGGYYVIKSAKAKATPAFSLSAEYTSITVNESDTFTVSAPSFPDGTSVTLWVSYNGSAWSSVGTQTIESGSATFTYTPTQAGTYYFQSTSGGSSP